jgi:hypothetical protein
MKPEKNTPKSRKVMSIAVMFILISVLINICAGYDFAWTEN